MGKGDMRTKRGKTKRGSYGKTRPKPASVRSEQKKNEKK
ncbi:MAG: 30S ribosomal protein THX [Bdellovibrionales bacterium]|nr:30S ribosomal protein THX [Bdellovibrionales bacterium]